MNEMSELIRDNQRAPLCENCLHTLLCTAPANVCTVSLQNSGLPHENWDPIFPEPPPPPGFSPPLPSPQLVLQPDRNDITLSVADCSV